MKVITNTNYKNKTDLSVKYASDTGVFIKTQTLKHDMGKSAFDLEYGSMVEVEDRVESKYGGTDIKSKFIFVPQNTHRTQLFLGDILLLANPVSNTSTSNPFKMVIVQEIRKEKIRVTALRCFIDLTSDGWNSNQKFSTTSNTWIKPNNGKIQLVQSCYNHTDRLNIFDIIKDAYRPKHFEYQKKISWSLTEGTCKWTRQDNYNQDHGYVKADMITDLVATLKERIISNSLNYRLKSIHGYLHNNLNEAIKMLVRKVIDSDIMFTVDDVDHSGINRPHYQQFTSNLMADYEMKLKKESTRKKHDEMKKVMLGQK
jgi:hypothetical protein